MVADITGSHKEQGLELGFCFRFPGGGEERLVLTPSLSSLQCRALWVS